MQQQLLQNRWFQGISLVLLFVSIALFSYTGNILFITPPFAFLYIILMGTNWKTAYWILLFFIPLSVQLSFMDDTLSTSLPDEPITWLFLLLFIIMWVRQPDMIPKWWWRNPLVFIITLQYLWLIVAVIFSKEQFISIKFLLSKTWYLTTFLVLPIWVFKEKKDYKKGFLIFLIPLLLTMIIILYKHWQLGFKFREIQKAVRYIYYNHVDYSTVMSMFFPLVCVALPLINKRKWWWKIITILVIAFFIPAIILSYARAAVIAVVFALIVGLAMRFRLVNFIMPAFYALIVLLLVYMTNNNKYIDFRPTYGRTYMHKNFTDHLISTFRGEDMSSMERLYRWIAAIRMSKDRPIVGYGPHAFYYYYKPYAVSSFRTYVSRNDEHSTTHNYFLLMLVEQGWPAMILYAILVIMMFAQAQKIYFRFKDKFYRSCTIGIAMMLAAGFINNFFSELIETHKIGALFYLGIALLILLDKKSRDMKEQEDALIQG